MYRFSISLSLLATIFAFGCTPQPTGPAAIDADAPTEFTTTETGLKYRILRKSDGLKPTSRDVVSVDYSGWLDNGLEFDSSYVQTEPARFQLGNVVPGYAEGLQLIGEGGMIELEIPAKLGYGEKGAPGKILPIQHCTSRSNCTKSIEDLFQKPTEYVGGYKLIAYAGGNSVVKVDTTGLAVGRSLEMSLLRQIAGILA